MGIIGRVNQIAAKPAYCRSIGANCTTSLAGHVNTILKNKIPFSRRLILNGYSDRLAYERGNIKNDLPFDELKEACRVSALAKEFDKDPAFSLKIRSRRGSEPSPRTK